MVLEKEREKTHKREKKRKEEEEEEEKRRKKEKKKKITGMDAMNICMKTMWVWKSSFGLESLDTWFGTLYFVCGLGLETLKLISC